jgi:hypothetical protein
MRQVCVLYTSGIRPVYFGYAPSAPACSMHKKEAVHKGGLSLFFTGNAYR